MRDQEESGMDSTLQAKERIKKAHKNLFESRLHMSIKLLPALKYATRLCSEYRLDLVQASPPLWSSPLHYSNYHITSLHPFSSITTTPPPQPLHQSTLSLTPCGWEGPSFGEGVSWITGFRLIHHPACRGWFKAKYPEHTKPQRK